MIEPACADGHQFWSSGHMRVQDPYSFMVGLHQLVAEAQERRFTGLIIDIEVHAGDEGIVLASNQGIRWHDLRPPLTALNLACRNNLFVFLAACDGSRLVRSIDLWQRAPFCGWIGVHGIVSPHMLRGATHAFFRTLLRTHDVTGAVAAAKEAAAREATQGGFNAQEIVCLMADQVFDHVMEASRRSLPTGDALARKVDEPAARARAEKAFLFETLGEAEFCRLVERVFTDPSELHRSLRRNFLMVDLFPELTSRFGGEEALPESTPAAR